MEINNLNSDMNVQARAAYNSLVNDPKLMPLSAFKSNRFSKYNLFPHAHSLPPFFDNNLQSEGRVVKYLRGWEGPLRAFYYQLFKLGFEIEGPSDYAAGIKNIIFSPGLNSESSSPTSGKQYTIGQYKRIIAEFIHILEGQVIPNAELTYSQYPIIDEAMLAILELIVVALGDTGDGQELYRYGCGCGSLENLDLMLTGLCNVFGITLQKYDSCYSFVESDVFLYVESLQSCYMAFISEMAEVESYEKTSEQPAGIDRDKQPISSNSYIEPKPQEREMDMYRNIRLSAGNKDKRIKVINVNNNLNKSVPSHNHYGSSSFGAPTGRADFQLVDNGANEQGLEKNVFASDITDRRENHQQAEELDQQIAQLHKVVSPEQIESHTLIHQLQSQKKLAPLTEPKPPSIAKQQPEAPLAEIVLKQKSLYDVQTIKSITENTSLLETKAERCGIDELATTEYQLRKKDSMKGDERRNILGRLEAAGKSGFADDDKEVGSQTLRRKSQVKVNNKIFQYEFKSFKYKKTTITSLEQPITAQRPLPEPRKQEISHETHKLEVRLKEELAPNLPKREHPKEIIHQTVNQQIKRETLTQRQDIDVLIEGLARKANQDINFFTPRPNPFLQPARKPDGQWETGGKQEATSFNKAKGDEDTLGTFYREFSNTKIMEAMIEPFKTRVRLSRQKFKGIRSKNFIGFF